MLQELVYLTSNEIELAQFCALSAVERLIAGQLFFHILLIVNKSCPKFALTSITGCFAVTTDSDLCYQGIHFTQLRC
jgi:hypothetical protein